MNVKFINLWYLFNDWIERLRCGAHCAHLSNEARAHKIQLISVIRSTCCSWMRIYGRIENTKKCHSLIQCVRVSLCVRVCVKHGICRSVTFFAEYFGCVALNSTQYGKVEYILCFTCWSEWKLYLNTNYEAYDTFIYFCIFHTRTSHIHWILIFLKEKWHAVTTATIMTTTTTKHSTAQKNHQKNRRENDINFYIGLTWISWKPASIDR